MFNLFFFSVFSFIVPFFMYICCFLISFKEVEGSKISSYECGFDSLTKLHTGLSIYFFFIILVFIIFELEVMIFIILIQVDLFGFFSFFFIFCVYCVKFLLWIFLWKVNMIY
uniref:NADH-ubiquinone oxidoreductase chain 3 n=1 Tax=Thelazia callipaeda TaxID=103827 RepID=A0A343IPF5_THECL|nr:NADH dehydrogenase subunit 3 [Thelazia callipaeda]ASS35189.1 NADH dehydrogenase subunit 3 [Thelazia callipaeda]